MTYRFKSDSDARSVAHHLGVAASRYDEYVKLLGNGSEENARLAAAFRTQAEQCRRIAAEIIEDVG